LPYIQFIKVISKSQIFIVIFDINEENVSLIIVSLSKNRHNVIIKEEACNEFVL